MHSLSSAAGVGTIRMMMANTTGMRPVRKTTRQESEGSSAMKDTSLRNRLLTNDARNSPAFSSQQTQHMGEFNIQLTRRAWRGESEPTGADV